MHKSSNDKKKPLFNIKSKKESQEESDTSNKRLFYSNKITAPIYNISGKKPFISELYDSSKTKELIKKIKSNTDMPEDVKVFLCYAAYRFTKINFKNVADYYPHATKEVQELMEELALVIIDFDKAIEFGFLKLDKKLQEELDKEYELYPKHRLTKKKTTDGK